MESLCFQPALPIAFGAGLDACTHPAQVNKLGRGSTISLNASGVSAERSAASTASSSGSYFSAFPLQFLWSSGEKGNDEIAPEEPGFAAGGGEEEIDEEEEEGIEGSEEEEEEEELIFPKKQRRGSWVLKILQIGSIWAEKAKRLNRVVETDDGSSTIDRDNCSCCCNDDGSDSCGVGDAEKTAVAFDTESFSRMLRRVSLAEARSYAQMSYLGNLAYNIPKIKPGNLLKYQGLRFVTSSLKKEAEAPNTEKSSILDKEPPVNDENEQISNHVQERKKETKELDEAPEGERKRKFGYGVSASAAYQIVATAASYLHSQTRSILPFRSRGEETTENSPKTVIGSNRKMEVTSSEAASFVVATNSVTAVVAGEEEMKQAFANDLSSPKSSPCQWFVCDDDSSATRFFVIQGSESFASWQANLLFEPIQFEGLEVLVHRGIYEVAKGIYEQILPEVQAHLRSHGDSATLRFTGHSLGGSLSMLLNLMLLIRGDAPLSSLLPVVTFGSPFIICGGDKLLYKLGLPHSHIQAIIMHRDIVPRAFSCCYPDRIVELLRAISGNFRNHPHLRNQKLLYAPMGELLILQPDEKFSPHHHLLPSGDGLYRFICPSSDPRDTTMQAAQILFLNSPHPLEILSDRSAYGSDGAIHRDHHMNAYLRSVRSVFHQEVRHARKANRECRRQAWWPIVAPPEALYASLILGLAGKLDNATQHQLQQQQLSLSNDSSQSRQEPWKWLSKLVESQHMPILMLFVVPMRFLFLGTVALMGVQ